MFINDLLIPLLMIICGRMMWNPPKSVNGMVGGILCAVQCVILIVSIFPTETALKRNFTDEGKRR
jgi:CDP-diglyceride synthetase